MHIRVLPRRAAIITPAPVHPAIVPVGPSTRSTIIVVVVVVLATGLDLAGQPTGAILALLAGACGLATRTARALTVTGTE